MTDNYFNTDIVRNHDDHLQLNNSMAETYDFCLGQSEKYTTLFNDADRAWYADRKRSFICYDV
jgi:hypothetical protein